MNIARVLKAHGRFGEVSVAALRGLPLLLERGLTVALTPPALDRDRFCRVEEVSRGGDVAYVKFSGIDSIADAQAVEGCHVLARRDDLDLGPLDIAYDELVGRTVIDARYGELGSVREVMETPANDVWVIDGGAYGEVLVPVIESVVSSIPPAGAIRVTVMDGLIDAAAPDAPGSGGAA